MKKILAFVLLAWCIPFSVMAESDTTNGQAIVETVQAGTLTVDNCEDLATILQLKSEFDDRIKKFAVDYSGQTIEFDGNIAYLSLHQRGDG